MTIPGAVIPGLAADRIVRCCVMLVLSGLCLAGAGCGAGQPAAHSGGLEQRSIEAGGRSRTWLYAPAPADAPAPVPLVMVFHGGQGDGRTIARQTRFHEVARREGFAVVYPDSVEYWQDGRATTGTGQYDIYLVRAIAARLVADEGIDPARIYATGASNGGMFTLRLACEASDLFAAVAPVIASFPVPYEAQCRPSRPVPVLMVNGTDDRLIQWRGGSIFKGARRGAGGEVVPVERTVAFWRQHNGCSAEASVEALPDRHPDDGTQVERIRYDGCAAGTGVELVKVVGGGHAWPSTSGGPPPKARRLVGNVSREYDASTGIWDFFEKFRLNNN